MVKNTLVVIGWIGRKRAYLNVPREEALRRYLEAHPEETGEHVEEAGVISVMEFEDEFEAYEIWEP